MSNRFHNKFHRHNHHTAPTDRDNLYPDSAYDPIASPESPFLGSFNLSGDFFGYFNGAFQQTLTANVGIFNNLYVRGDITQLDTIVNVTSSVYIHTDGTAPSINLSQHGNADIFVATNSDLNSKFSIKANNYVGIGIFEPESILHVKNTNVYGNNLDEARFILESINQTSKIDLKGSTGNKICFISYPLTNPYYTIAGDAENSSLKLNSAATDTILNLQSQNGNSLIVNSIGTSSNQGGLLVTNYDSTQNYGQISIDGSSNIYFNTLSSLDQRMVIKGNGNVGVNTNTPNEVFTVAGNISASGNIAATGNIVSLGNITNSGSISSLGNITNVGNINSLGNITSVGSISSSNLIYDGISNSLNWSSVYTSTKEASATWDTVTLRLPLSGGIVHGNLTVYGNVSAAGESVFSNTFFTTTSSLSISYVGSETALYVEAAGSGDIASFYDLDQGTEVLHIGGANSTHPNVGIKVSEPNKDFTVKGEISATGIIYTSEGNSDQWNAAYYNTQLVSLCGDNWSTSYDTVKALSAAWSGTELKPLVSRTITVTANNCSVDLTIYHDDYEIVLANTNTYVNGITGFTNCIKGITYTLTNKTLTAINIQQNNDIFIRTGHNWRVNTSNPLSAFVTLPYGASCSVRADSVSSVSVW